MTRARRRFHVPSIVLPQLMVFITEICDQSLAHHNLPVAVRFEGSEIGKNGLPVFTIYIMGNITVAKQVLELCAKAESGSVSIPAPVNPGSRAVGKLKERITFDGEIYSVIKLEGSKYGTKYLHRIHDSFGNELFWKTGTRMYKKGKYSISGQVAQHIRKSGMTQTKLLRCKLLRREE